MIKILFSTILIFTFQQVTSQVLPSGDKINSIQQLYSIVDTTKMDADDANSSTISVNWMDSLIQIRVTEGIKYDLEEQRKYRRDSTYIPDPADTLRFVEMRKDFSQNCHSYALEKYFKDANIKDGALFTEWTALVENYYMDKILITAFEKMITFEPKRKRCNDCDFERGSLIVFRNEWNSPIHTVYYDGKFHSKYGGLPAKEEDKIEAILKRYYNSSKIEAYLLDDKKISRFINDKQ